MKKYFIIGDIHSHYDLMLQSLEAAGFEVHNSKHILVIAGDVLDRGHQGHQLIGYLEDLILKDRVIGVLGNHDEFLLSVLEKRFKISDVLWNIEKNGFCETLKLGQKNHNSPIDVTEENILKISDYFLTHYPVFSKWLMNLPLYLEFKHHVIVHAFLDFSLDDWRNTSKHFAIWERRYEEKLPENFEKKLIFGHTPNIAINEQHDIIYKDNKIMIDGGAGYGYQVNTIVIDENKI